LGTDIAAGYSPSMLDACRTAVLAGKTLGWGAAAGGAADSAANSVAGGAAGGATEHEVDFKLAFWTATLGGALALGLEAHLLLYYILL
jgi:cytosine/adenosine deaminase-related metal-dependent hydrolase